MFLHIFTFNFKINILNLITSTIMAVVAFVLPEPLAVAAPFLPFDLVAIPVVVVHPLVAAHPSPLVAAAPCHHLHKGPHQVPFLHLLP